MKGGFGAGIPFSAIISWSFCSEAAPRQPRAQWRGLGNLFQRLVWMRCFCWGAFPRIQGMPTPSHLPSLMPKPRTKPALFEGRATLRAKQETSALGTVHIQSNQAAKGEKNRSVGIRHLQILLSLGRSPQEMSSAHTPPCSLPAPHSLSVVTAPS